VYDFNSMGVTSDKAVLSPLWICYTDVASCWIEESKQFSQYTLQMPWEAKGKVRRFSLRVPLIVFQTLFATIQINLPRMLHDLRRDPSRSNMCSALAAEHGFLALHRK
jgi:hypothetical protein